MTIDLRGGISMSYGLIDSRMGTLISVDVMHLGRRNRNSSSVKGKKSCLFIPSPFSEQIAKR
jgi:hypothetical protein